MTVEVNQAYQAGDVQVIVGMETAEPYGPDDKRTHVERECYLTRRRFLTPMGGVIFTLTNRSMIVMGNLSPESAALGPDALREALLKRAALRREDARAYLTEAAHLEAAALMPVLFVSA